MRRLKIGIRPQLIILVGFSSLFSLLILAIVTGVYFSSNLSNLRAERLQVISQLKTTQIQQSVEYIYYQIYWLSNKDTVYAPLNSHVAGNGTHGIFADAQKTLDQFLTSSELFSAARLYDLYLDVVAESYNNETSISTPTMDYLFPLSANTTIPSSLLNTTNQASGYGYVTGPMSNSSDVLSEYFIGITVPVYSNSSIILSEPSISGYLTVLASASNIQSAIYDPRSSQSDDSSVSTKTKSSSTSTTSDYYVVAVKPIFETNSSSGSGSSHDKLPIGFEPVFPTERDLIKTNHAYGINSSDAIKLALTKETGSSTKIKSYTDHWIAIGFTQIRLDEETYWSVLIEQPRSKFLEPIKKLTKIIIGVVIGIGAFMCLITFPLAVFFVRPITKLKEATFAITMLKKQHKKHMKEKELLSATTSESDTSINHHQNFGDSLKVPPSSNPPINTSVLSKRHSVNSTESCNNSSVYSTGIRLPSKIPNSKKFFKDELTELSEAFNIMIEELDKQYTHLEDRVKIRTKELEASKVEAEAANEAKTVFIANISHELRTPLNGILGMTSIALEEKNHARIQDSLKLIHRSGELLLHILTELLTYSKNTLNRSKLEKSHFQILEIAYQVQSIFGKLASDQRVKLNLSLKPNAIRKLFLYGDSNRIIQIVMNLVSNSLKFTPVDGSVDVSFKLLGEYDFNRSKLDNFDKVYILRNSNNSSSPPKTSPTSAKSTATTTTTANNTFNSTPIPTPVTANTSIPQNPESVNINNPNTKYYHNKTTPETPISNESNPNNHDIELSTINSIKSINNEEVSRNSQSALRPFSSNSSSSRPMSLGLEDDNISVVTLSTAEYENTIFQSQFNRNSLIRRASNNHKPLPERPNKSIHKDFKESDTDNANNNDENHKSVVTNGNNHINGHADSERAKEDSDKTVHESDTNENPTTPKTDTNLNSSKETVDEKPMNGKANNVQPPKENVIPPTPPSKLTELSRDELLREQKAELLPPKKACAPPKNNSNVSLSTTMTNSSNMSQTSTFSNSEMVKNNKVFKMRNLYEPKTWVLQIEVSDTGPGIEPALQEKVFEPFIQGDQTLSRSYGGTGLGLSICRQLAKMMNGTLTLKSTIGQGSTFTFTVPLPQTGEVLVPESEMDEFCDDEFNPKSKVNRKVAFDISDDSTNSEHNETETTIHSSSSQTQPGVFQFNSNGESLSNTEMNRDKDHESSHDSEYERDHESETPIVKVEDNSSTSSHGYSFNTKASKASSDSNDTRRFKHKLEIPSRTALFEKPHLIARSSTGTANSSNTTDKTDHNLLEEMAHLRILVAEDNMVNQEVIKRMLKLEGFQNITMAFNGAEAVEFVKESYEKFELFDLIFMDIQMPNIDGLTATKMIRNNLRYDRPIIALTAFADESNVKECLNCGMSGFLAKPIKRTNLRKIINEFSPSLLNDIITTPQTNQSDEKRLGYGSGSEMTRGSVNSIIDDAQKSDC